MIQVERTADFHFAREDGKIVVRVRFHTDMNGHLASALTRAVLMNLVGPFNGKTVEPKEGEPGTVALLDFGTCTARATTESKSLTEFETVTRFETEPRGDCELMLRLNGGVDKKVGN